jgi:hypothetical protein
MRALLAGLFALTFVQAAAAQTVLKREPHYLASGVVVFVDNGQCGVGKLMKVTGISKGTSRRKVCVTIVPQHATLAAVPAL